jgi:hypothetical protein
MLRQTSRRSVADGRDHRLDPGELVGVLPGNGDAHDHVRRLPARTVSGQRFYLVATRCPTCGTASVYLGGRYISAVNLHASTTQRQAVIALPAQASMFSGTLKITTRSTGKLVQIDGLAVRRT